LRPTQLRHSRFVVAAGAGAGSSPSASSAIASSYSRKAARSVRLWSAIRQAWLILNCIRKCCVCARARAEPQLEVRELILALLLDPFSDLRCNRPKCRRSRCSSPM
jgi:hypothetical protein